MATISQGKIKKALTTERLDDPRSLLALDVEVGRPEGLTLDAGTGEAAGAAIAIVGAVDVDLGEAVEDASPCADSARAVGPSEEAASAGGLVVAGAGAGVGVRVGVGVGVGAGVIGGGRGPPVPRGQK